MRLLLVYKSEEKGSEFELAGSNHTIIELYFILAVDLWTCVCNLPSMQVRGMS